MPRMSSVVILLAVVLEKMKFRFADTAIYQIAQSPRTILWDSLCGVSRSSTKPLPYWAIIVQKRPWEYAKTSENNLAPPLSVSLAATHVRRHPPLLQLVTLTQPLTSSLRVRREKSSKH